MSRGASGEKLYHTKFQSSYWDPEKLEQLGGENLQRELS